MKNLALGALFCCCFLAATAQDEDSDEKTKKKFDPSRLVFGGNLGASFGNFTFINVSPQVGYRFTDWFTAGAGINFIYQGQKVRDIQGQQLYKTSVGYAGMNVFGRVFPIRFIMLSAQPELNYNWGKVRYDDFAYPNVPDEKLDGKFVPSLLAGAGLVIPAGRRGATIISLQYDVIQNERSPYGKNAFVSVNFTF